ncbi:MAG: ChbG/HpnK family deacetylase [Candidatus Omnitrophota bacterium]
MPNSIQRVVYHADDIGASFNVTCRILEAWQQGLLDGFSIFANSYDFNEITERLKADKHRQARIGIHLNLWEGRSILAPQEIPQLVCKNGYFKVDFLSILKQYVKGTRKYKELLVAEVEREWRAQIEKVLKEIEPRPLCVVDSHVHMHMLPFLFRVAVSLAKEYGIQEIRIVREPFYFSPRRTDLLSGHFANNLVKHCILKFCSFPNTRLAKKAGVKYFDAMLGVLYSGMMNHDNIERGIWAANRRGAKSLEVLMHIGRASRDELSRWGKDVEKASFALSVDRDQEYHELMHCQRVVKNEY